ncbi:MAG: 16S rRNA (uracil(1498)-N(3))-methyltransferase [Oscillospiraceae bacterium]|nr:16S rRNA (uracil(1498)-N(3))-methyltransferase [Oscillospiraceae bacterium]
MFRFFADINNISAAAIKLSDEDSKHIRSLRLRPDEKFIVCDGNSTEYVCTLDQPDKFTNAVIISSHNSKSEPTVSCKSYIAFSKGDRLDYAVQKLVELGINEIILFKSSRCVAIPHDIPKKVTRLQRIVLETAKMSGRGIIPKVSYSGDFEETITEALTESKLTLFFYENEEKLNIKSILNQHFPDGDENKINNNKHISIITGPEGGFTEQEVEYSRSKKIPVVSLGSRVLRSETAPVVALAAIMYHTDNL